jgi:hypothetical protein
VRDIGDPERDVGALMRNVPDAGTIRAIGDTPDNELRAHRIALAYHQISRALNARLRANEPDGVYNANWFNFALWGTLTVTGNIDNTRAPQRLNTLLASPLRRRLSPGVVRAKAADGQLVGRALAWGQRMIFLSTALSISAYLFERLAADGRQLDGSSSVDRAASYRSTMHDVVESTAQDPSSEAPPTEDRLQRKRHQDAIDRAMRMYEVAEHATGRDKAQLVFGANVLLTEVEQDIVDPALTKIVDLVPRKVGSAIDWRLARGATMVRGIPPHVAYVGLQRRREDWRRLADFAWARFMTDQVFVMALPTETVRLGRDIPAWRRDQPYYPPDLQDLTPDERRPFDAADRDVTAWLHDVDHRVRSLDRTSADGRGSAARDWRRWDERMNWAITLMRSRQHDTTLTWSPYSQEDQRRIIALQLPLHGGDPSALEVASALDKHVFDDVNPATRRYP